MQEKTVHTRALGGRRLSLGPLGLCALFRIRGPFQLLLIIGDRLGRQEGGAAWRHNAAALVAAAALGRRGNYGEDVGEGGRRRLDDDRGGVGVGGGVSRGCQLLAAEQEAGLDGGKRVLIHEGLGVYWNGKEDGMLAWNKQLLISKN